MVCRIGFHLFQEDRGISMKCPYIVSSQRKEFSLFAIIFHVLSVNNYTDGFGVVWDGSKERNWMVPQVETTKCF